MNCTTIFRSIWVHSCVFCCDQVDGVDGQEFGIESSEGVEESKQGPEAAKKVKHAKSRDGGDHGSVGTGNTGSTKASVVNALRQALIDSHSLMEPELKRLKRGLQMVLLLVTLLICMGITISYMEVTFFKDDLTNLERSSRRQEKLGQITSGFQVLQTMSEDENIPETQFDAKRAQMQERLDEFEHQHLILYESLKGYTGVSASVRYIALWALQT